MGFARLASMALVGLIGCAGVLGFEDITVDTPLGDGSNDGGTSGTPSTGGTSSGGTSSGGASSGGTSSGGADAGPARCRSTSAFANPRAIDEVRDNGRNAWVRLSQDELTMTWMRRPNGATDFGPVSSTRSKVGDPWGPVTPLGSGAANLFAPSPSDNGLTFYFSVISSDKKTRRLASAPKQSLASRTTFDLMPLADDLYIIRSDRTNETFFASNRDPSGPRDVTDGAYSIYRARGPFGADDSRAEKLALDPGIKLATTDDLWLLEPVLSNDGLDLYYTAYVRTAPASPSMRGTFVASRPSVDAEFGPSTLVPTPSTDDVRLGFVSADNCRGYFYVFDPPISSTSPAHIAIMDRMPE